MEKAGISQTMRSHMKARSGTRPYRASTLLEKNTATMPAPWSEKEPTETSTAGDFTKGIAGALGGEEFETEKEAASLKTELLPHQQRVVERMKEQPGLVVAHGTGSGKTLSSIGAMVDLGPHKARVVVPASLKENYAKEIKKHVKGGLPVEVESLQKAVKDGNPPRADLLVVDEAHRIRNPSSKGYRLMRDAPSERRMLLTASPVYNMPEDVAPLVNVAAGERVLQEGAEFRKRFVQKPGRGLLTLLNPWARRDPRLINKDELSDVLNRWVDYHGGSEEGFPELSERRINVPMTDRQSKLHAAAWGRLPLSTRMRLNKGLPPDKKDLAQLNRFQSQARQISSSEKKFVQEGVKTEASPKVVAAVDRLQEKVEGNPRHRALVYANYLGTLDDYSGQLTQRGIPHAYFRGDTPKRQREQNVRDYNAGKIKALLVSGAGGEGLDLKGTRQVQVLEPHWNEERLRQVIGRARRFQSHDHLPSEERHVEVERYAARPRAFLGGTKKGVEDILYDVAEQKQRLNDQVLGLMTKSGAEIAGQAKKKILLDPGRSTSLRRRLARGKTRRDADDRDVGEFDKLWKEYRVKGRPLMKRLGFEKASAAKWRELMRLGGLSSDDILKLRKAKLLDYAREIAGLEKGTKAMAREMGVKAREYPMPDVDKIGPDRFWDYVRTLGPKKMRQFVTAQSVGAGAADPVTAQAHFWPGLLPLGAGDSARAHKGALRAILRRHEIDELRSMQRLGALKQSGEVVEARLPEHFYTHTHPEVIARQQGNLAMMHPKVQQAKSVSMAPGDEAEAAHVIGAVLGREGDVLKGGVTPKEMATLRKLYDPIVRGEVSEMGALTKHFAKSAAEIAPGIPSVRVRRIPVVKPGAENEEWDLSMSLHPARRRGDHIDLRLVDPKGRAHSWALPKDLPDPGKSTYAVQQPTHTGEYALQQRPFVLPKGYGETRPGEKVQPISVGKTEVVEAGESKVRFLRHLGRRTEEFVLRRIKTPTGDGKKLWAFHNATKNRATTEGRRLPDYKPKYKEVEPEKIDVEDGSKVLSAKIDGASGLLHLHGKDAFARLYSYRRPVSGTTGLVEHTHKMPGFHTRTSPNALRGTVVRTEMWFSDKDGKAIPNQKVGGILNASTVKSRRMQEEQGVKPRLTITDVVRSGGKNMEKAPYAEKLKVMERVAKDVPGVEMPRIARTAEEKKRLLADVKSGRLPETKEGVVEHDLWERGAAFVKAVFKPVQDVFVRGIFKKPRGEARGHAGGIEYSYTPDGPVVGRVGTGFDHKTRKDMLANPESYVGRVAKVRSSRAFENRADPSQLGALRAPAFKGWHIDKTDPALLKEAAEALRERLCLRSHSG